jgi:hypothetical protein
VCASGGFLVGLFGLRVCYMLDSLTYIVSALLMTIMGGKGNVTQDGPSKPPAYIKGDAI